MCSCTPFSLGNRQTYLAPPGRDVEEERAELRRRDPAPISNKMKMEPPRGHTTRDLKVAAPQPGQPPGAGTGWMEFRRRLSLTTSTCSLSTLGPTSTAPPATSGPPELSGPSMGGAAGPGRGGRRESSVPPSKHTLFSQGRRKTASAITQGPHAIYRLHCGVLASAWRLHPQSFWPCPAPTAAHSP